MTVSVEARARYAHDDVLADATLLLVDDNPQNLALLRRILEKAGVERLHGTQDPTAVVGLCASLRPDLVLLDLHMPGMDGVAVMDAIAATTGDDEFLPVIVLTADATTETRDRVLAAGANDFLTKPLDAAEVVLRSRNLLHTRALHARLSRHNIALRSEILERRRADDLARAAAAEKAVRIRGVLDAGGPRMVFQPITALATGAVVGYEALARFDHEPSRGPDVWFAEAAEAGLADELELAAVKAGLAQLARIGSGRFLSLNVSPSVMMCEGVLSAVAASDSRALVLEVTEHSRVADYDRLHAALEPMRAAGARLAVDDAGAGYASLAHILRLRPDVIKLDIALVRDIDADPVKRALASSLVTFGAEIGATITAEGVETAGELEALLDLGVQHGQGYHLGRPAPLPSSGDGRDG